MCIWKTKRNLNYLDLFQIYFSLSTYLRFRVHIWNNSMSLCSVIMAHTVLEVPSNKANIVPTEPDWASYTLGIFVCLNCSGMHRNLPAVSRVKSTRLDLWEDSLVEVVCIVWIHLLVAIYSYNRYLLIPQPRRLCCHSCLLAGLVVNRITPKNYCTDYRATWWKDVEWVGEEPIKIWWWSN